MPKHKVSIELQIQYGAWRVYRKNMGAHSGRLTIARQTRKLDAQACLTGSVELPMEMWRETEKNLKQQLG